MANIITKNTNLNFYFGFGKDKENKNKLFIDSNIRWDIPTYSNTSSPIELFMLSKSHTNIYASKPELSDMLSFFNKFLTCLFSTFNSKCKYCT